MSQTKSGKSRGSLVLAIVAVVISAGSLYMSYRAFRQAHKSLTINTTPYMRYSFSEASAQYVAIKSFYVARIGGAAVRLNGIAFNKPLNDKGEGIRVRKNHASCDSWAWPLKVIGIIENQSLMAEP